MEEIIKLLDIIDMAEIARNELDNRENEEINI
jgi:hypothetical protein